MIFGIVIHYSYDSSEILASHSFHICKMTSHSHQTFYIDASNMNVHKYSPLTRMCSIENRADDRFAILSCNMTIIKCLTILYLHHFFVILGILKLVIPYLVIGFIQLGRVNIKKTYWKEVKLLNVLHYNRCILQTLR